MMVIKLELKGNKNMKEYKLLDFEKDCLIISPDPDPIRHYSGKERGWFFWNETWSDLHGPYENLIKCKEALNEYCEKL